MDSVDPHHRDAKKRTAAFLAVILCPVGFGAADLFLYFDDTWQSVSQILSTLVGVVTIVMWCTYDARIRGFPFIGRLRVLVWLLAAIGVPIYLKRTRGWIGAAKIGFGLPVFAAGIGTYYAGWYGSRWIAATIGYFQ